MRLRITSGMLALVMALVLCCPAAGALALTGNLQVDLVATGLAEGKVEAYGTFTVDVKLSDTDESGSLAGLAGLLVDVQYDPASLTVKEAVFKAGDDGYIHAINPVYVDGGNTYVRLVFVNSGLSAGLAPNSTIMTITFTAKGSTDGETNTSLSAGVAEAYWMDDTDNGDFTDITTDTQVPEAPTKVTVNKATYVRGDVDNNGEVLINDAGLVLRHVAKVSLLDLEEQIRSDIDQNGDIGINDVGLILKRVANLLDENYQPIVA